MANEKTYDLFIAYHGNNSSSSYLTAERIYMQLVELGYNNIYLDTQTNKHGSFGDTPRIVQHSKLFLFVVDKDVPRTRFGFLKQKKKNGRIRRIWQEIYAFRESDSYMTNPDVSAKLFLCEGIDENHYEDYTKLDSMFNGKVCLHEKDFSDVVDWLKHSPNITPQRNNSLNNKNTREKNNKEPIKWNATLAEMWQDILPPSKPSVSEIGIYKEILKKIKEKAQYPEYKALILGTTNEFREMLLEEGFSITIVDVSEEYHKRIIKNKPINRKRESVVFCDWLNISKSSKITENSYDVVIGDLAVGNIIPEKLNDFINQIDYVLKPNGFFLGKTVFKFNSIQYTQSDIISIFDNFFKSQIEHQKLYEKTMYPLTLYLADNNNKINFPAIYDNVQLIKEKYTNIDDSVFDIYIGENTSFKDKMKLDFFVYPIKNFLHSCSDRFYISDIKYGNELYSKEFPLVVLKKKNFTQNSKVQYDNKRKLYHEIAKFLQEENSDAMIEHWTQSLTSQYFLANITTLLGAKHYREFTLKIKRKISNYIQKNTHVAINENLDCYIDFYFDSKMLLETIEKYPDFKLNDSMKNKLKRIDDLNFEEKRDINKYFDTPLKTNYIWGLLCYLTFFSSNEHQNMTNSMVIDNLFSLIKQGEIWLPDEALWVTARICISVFPIYSILSKENKDKFNEVVSHIIFSYENESHGWNNYKYSSKEDTFALCLMVLLEYIKIVEDEEIKRSIRSIFEDILDFYVLDNNIYDTLQRFYVGKQKILKAKNSIKDCREINDNLSVLSVLIKLMDYYQKSENIETINMDEIQKAETLLLDLIYRCWKDLKTEIYLIEENAQKYEYSLVPQIIYSLIASIYKEVS